MSKTKYVVIGSFEISENGEQTSPSIWRIPIDCSDAEENNATVQNIWFTLEQVALDFGAPDDE